MFSPAKRQMHACTQKHKMPPLAVAFHFFRKLTCSEPNSACVCGALCLSWDTLIRSTLTANTTTNQGDSKMTVDGEKRKCSFTHSFPTSVYQLGLSVCVCVHSCQCVFRNETVCVCLSLSYEYSSVAGL